MRVGIVSKSGSDKLNVSVLDGDIISVFLNFLLHLCFSSCFLKKKEKKA